MRVGGSLPPGDSLYLNTYTDALHGPFFYCQYTDSQFLQKQLLPHFQEVGFFEEVGSNLLRQVTDNLSMHSDKVRGGMTDRISWSLSYDRSSHLPRF